MSEVKHTVKKTESATVSGLSEKVEIIAKKLIEDYKGKGTVISNDLLDRFDKVEVSAEELEIVYKMLDKKYNHIEVEKNKYNIKIEL